MSDVRSTVEADMQETLGLVPSFFRTVPDYLIATERWPCAKGTSAVLVDEVTRFGRSFAQIYAQRRGLGD